MSYHCPNCGYKLGDDSTFLNVVHKDVVNEEWVASALKAKDGNEDPVVKTKTLREHIENLNKIIEEDDN